MRVVVDTNIAFSAILNTSSIIGDLLFNSENQFSFYSPEFVEVELSKYSSKLQKTTSMNDEQLRVAVRQVFNKIHLISNEVISPEHWKAAYQLTSSIDEKDTPFIAVTLSMNAILWTGDKKLITGLERRDSTIFRVRKNYFKNENNDSTTTTESKSLFTHPLYKSVLNLNFSQILPLVSIISMLILLPLILTETV